MKLKKGKYHFLNLEEKENFKQEFPFLCNKEMVKVYGCSLSTIIRIARKLKLQKDEIFRYQFNFKKWGQTGGNHPKAILTQFQPDTHYSEKTEYKLGNMPWIAGKTLSERYIHTYRKTA